MDALPASAKGAGEFVDCYCTVAGTKEEKRGGVVNAHACDEKLFGTVF